MRIDHFQQVLEDLNRFSSDIEASALIFNDGLVIASVGLASVDDDRVGAMSAALLWLGGRAGRELARGSIDRIMIQSTKGYVITTAAGEEAILTIMATPNAALGLIFSDIKRAADTLAKLI